MAKKKKISPLGEGCLSLSLILKKGRRWYNLGVSLTKQASPSF